MRTIPASAAMAALFILLSGLAGFTVGCATSSEESAPPKPGQGIAEYRKVVGTAHQAVEATVNALEELLPPTQTPAPVASLKRFDKAMSHLETTSVKARARAEAIIARGQTYFDEWKEHLAASTNPPAAAESERYNRLHDHFLKVRQASGGVREEFRPFMNKLREFRARLDKAGSTVAGPTESKERLEVLAGGRRVLDALDAVARSLDAAETELRATPAAQ